MTNAENEKNKKRKTSDELTRCYGSIINLTKKRRVGGDFGDSGVDR